MDRYRWPMPRREARVHRRRSPRRRAENWELFDTAGCSVYALRTPAPRAVAVIYVGGWSSSGTVMGGQIRVQRQFRRSMRGVIVEIGSHVGSQEVVDIRSGLVRRVLAARYDRAGHTRERRERFELSTREQAAAIAADESRWTPAHVRVAGGSVAAGSATVIDDLTVAHVSVDGQTATLVVARVGLGEIEIVPVRSEQRDRICRWFEHSGRRSRVRRSHRRRSRARHR